MNRITEDNWNPIITVTSPRWSAPKRLTLEQVLRRLWPRTTDTEADLSRKLRAAQKLPTSHPAIRSARWDAIDQLCDALDLSPEQQRAALEAK